MLLRMSIYLYTSAGVPIAEAGGILGVNAPHFFGHTPPLFRTLKTFYIFHGQSLSFRKSETVTLFNYYTSQISVVAKGGGGPSRTASFIQL